MMTRDIEQNQSQLYWNTNSFIKRSFLILMLVAVACTSNTKSSKNWINENAIGLSTIDPLDSNTNELRYLKDAIGNSRVVLLGEAEHGDGSTFLLKSRVAKYLHQVLGFRVLAFEGSFFGLNNSWEEYVNKRAGFEQLKNNLYIMWRESKQCEELFEYIERQSKTNDPLVLSGVDSRQVGELKIAAMLDSILTSHNLISDRDEYSFFINTLNDVLNLEYKHKISIDEQNRFLEILKQYEQHLTNANVDNFWIQELKNTRGYALHSWRSAIDESKDLYNGNFRDRQMADNLAWLLNEKYKGEKIIVWAANTHVVKNFSTIDSTFYGQDEILIRGAEHSMGEYLHDIGVSIYSIITVYYSGKGAGFDFKEYPYENAKVGSLENMLHQQGFKFAFLDVKNNDSRPGEVQMIRSGMPGYVNVNLKATCDGIFFIDRMNPITKSETNVAK